MAGEKETTSQKKGYTPEPTNEDIVNLVTSRLGVEVVDKDEFSKRVNDAIVDFIIPRLLTKQMEIDNIIKAKN